jgi:hypothetical protein
MVSDVVAGVAVNVADNEIGGVRMNCLLSVGLSFFFTGWKHFFPVALLFNFESKTIFHYI